MVSLRLFGTMRIARLWIAVGVLAPFGMLVVSGLLLRDLRHDAWERADHTSNNLLQVIERDITRNIEIIDHSLRAIADNLKIPDIAKADPELRQRILFDRAANAKDMSVMLVIDENGDIKLDAGANPPRKANFADRAYFQAHKIRADLGLFVGTPLVSRLTGHRMIPFSRRITKADGSFGGVVLGTLKLTYFVGLFDRLGLGREGAINLYHHDGTRIARQPSVDSDIGANIAGTSNFERFLREIRGSFVGISTRDAIERRYTFTRIGELPLILDVALATDDIEAEWRVKALVMSVIVGTLCALTMGLSLLFGRELKRRAAVEAELAQLSMTDTLTGLPNRRRFDDAIATTWKSARRAQAPLSLLIVDADHFKRYNDCYGHTVGDEVLKGLAHCLSASVYRPGDLVCRVGGEEFVVLLPNTDRFAALRIAEAIHQAVMGLSIASAGIASGSVTVSIGLASARFDGGETRTAKDLYHGADMALYAAKAGGRNQTRCAETDEPLAARRRRMLRVVSAA